MPSLRDYQRAAVNEVLKLFAAGKRRVVLVAPTGSGKTVMAREIAGRARAAKSPVSCLSHRVEIVSQLDDLGPSMSVQSWIGNTLFPADGLLILDECHHYCAPEWSKVFDAPWKYILGLTATPQRQNGTPLGNYFDAMVVAAQAPQLVEAGHLVECDISRPSECIAPNLAKHPVEAYKTLSPEGRAFCYCRYAPQAEELARQFAMAGIQAAAITGITPKDLRKQYIEDFRAGKLRVLVNVFTLTEGLDVPEADTCILARGCSFTGAYLQMVGRVLRPHPSKTRALLIDLTGSSHLHGLPLAERVYSLDRGIELPPSVAVHQCPACGQAFATPFVCCPNCEFNSPKKNKERPRIRDVELERVWSGGATPVAAKAKELERLLAIARKRDWGLYWVVKEYKKLFSEQPPIPDTSAAKLAELGKSIAFARERGFKMGWATWRFKETFGHWPPKEYINILMSEEERAT